MKNDDLKVAIIGIYYGNFPNWMPYWLKSCEDNKTIDFLLVTDIKDIKVPNNIKIIDMSLKELKILIEKKLNIEVSLEKAYKTCDFRPAYGKIFEDYLKEYDYWGHCDFDLIWGDIRKFTELYEIEKYDKFLHLGHLALYRNIEKVNNYYKLDGSECGNYDKIFTSEKNYAFDETGGIYCIFKKHNFPIFDQRIFAEIKTFHKRFRLSRCDKNYKHQVFYYENGKIYRAYVEKSKVKLQEFIYIHFRRKLDADKLKDLSKENSFYITYDGFIEKKEGIPTIDEIEKYNHNPGYFIEMFETFKFIVKNFDKMPKKLYYKIRGK